LPQQTRIDYVLDIRNIEPWQVSPDPIEPDMALPRGILEAGYVPDISVLQPGDLILSALLSKFELVPSGISFAQGTGYSQRHSRWTHVAVYLGNQFLICEATRKGVKLGSLLHTVLDSVVRVRRGFNDGAFLDRESGWRTALFSVARLTEPYDYSHAGEIGRLAMMTGLSEYRRKSPKNPERPDSTICSELFQDAYCRATGRLVQNQLSREVTPALLSASDMLEDVPCRWRKLSC
jgi:hypothetical protein